MASDEIRQWWQLHDVIADCERLVPKGSELAEMFAEHSEHMTQIAEDLNAESVEAKARSIAIALDCDSEKPFLDLLEDIRREVREKSAE